MDGPGSIKESQEEQKATGFPYFGTAAIQTADLVREYIRRKKTEMSNCVSQETHLEIHCPF